MNTEYNVSILISTNNFKELFSDLKNWPPSFLSRYLPVKRDTPIHKYIQSYTNRTHVVIY